MSVLTASTCPARAAIIRACSLDCSWRRASRPGGGDPERFPSIQLVRQDQWRVAGRAAALDAGVGGRRIEAAAACPFASATCSGRLPSRSPGFGRLPSKAAPPRYPARLGWREPKCRMSALVRCIDRDPFREQQPSNSFVACRGSEHEQRYVSVQKQFVSAPRPISAL